MHNGTSSYSSPTHLQHTVGSGVICHAQLVQVMATPSIQSRWFPLCSTSPSTAPSGATRHVPTMLPRRAAVLTATAAQACPECGSCTVRARLLLVVCFTSTTCLQIRLADYPLLCQRHFVWLHISMPMPWHCGLLTRSSFAAHIQHVAVLQSALLPHLLAATCCMSTRLYLSTQLLCLQRCLAAPQWMRVGVHASSALWWRLEHPPVTPAVQRSTRVE